VVKQGKQRACQWTAHLPSTQFQKVKFKTQPLSKQEQQFASLVQDWEDLSDEEQTELLTKHSTNTAHLNLDNLMASGSGTAAPTTATLAAPPVSPTMANCLQLINDIGQAMGLLTNQVTALTAQVAANVAAPAPASPSKKDIVSKPKCWNMISI